MKKIVLKLLFVLTAVSVSLYGQTATVNVASDLTNGTEGNLNNAISKVITADPTGKQLSNTVFKLEANGYYLLTGTITTPAHSHLYLVGPAPGLTQATALPQIAWTASGGVTTTFSFDCGGDLTMTNVWVLCANGSGAQVSSAIVLEDDSIADLSGGKGENLWMDGCIIDYMGIGNGGGAIEPSCQHFRGHITNTYFRNMTDSHYRYYGRAVSWTYQSTTWHTDTLNFENCTFSNCGYAYMQESPEYGILCNIQPLHVCKHDDVHVRVIVLVLAVGNELCVFKLVLVWRHSFGRWCEPFRSRRNGQHRQRSNIWIYSAL